MSDGIPGDIPEDVWDRNVAEFERLASKARLQHKTKVMQRQIEMLEAKVDELETKLSEKCTLLNSALMRPYVVQQMMIEDLQAENRNLATGACVVEEALRGDERGNLYCNVQAENLALIATQVQRSKLGYLKRRGGKIVGADVYMDFDGKEAKIERFGHVTWR